MLRTDLFIGVIWYPIITNYCKKGNTYCITNSLNWTSANMFDCSADETKNCKLVLLSE